MKGKWGRNYLWVNVFKELLAPTGEIEYFAVWNLPAEILLQIPSVLKIIKSSPHRAQTHAYLKWPLKSQCYDVKDRGEIDGVWWYAWSDINAT